MSLNRNIRTGALIILFFSIRSLAVAQKNVAGATPIREFTFKTISDSIAFSKTDGLLRSGGLDIKSWDSLLNLRNELLKLSTGVRYLYKPRYPIWGELSPGQRAQIKNISFVNWSSEKLPDSLGLCPKLEKIEIINSAVRTIQKEINVLPKLTTIEFYNNHPRRRLSFEPNDNITNVLIRSTTPAGLPRSYKNLHALEKLDLSRTKTRSFPEIFRNRRINRLIMMDNGLVRVPVSKFRKQRSLEHFDLHSNKIVSVPNGIRNLPSLKSLALNVNKVSKVSPKIRRLQKLEDLSFYSNDLTAIPTSFFELTNLKKLDLYYNRITDIQNAVANWKNLNVLGLDNNNITALPANLGDMASLTEIYLNHNRLSELPQSVERLTRMKAIQLNHNYLTQFPTQILAITNLENLDISDNRISAIPEQLFDLKKFEILCLYGNPYTPEMLEKLSVWVEKIRSDKTFVLIEPPPGFSN